MDNDGIKFSQTSTFGNHLYRRRGEIAEIIFENERLGVRKVIVDDNGKIQDFPGVMYPDVVSNYSMAFNTPIIRYRSSIECLDGQYALIWQIEPDGRYWEDDDGFGRTSDEEINLYARMDEKGKFIEAFRLYEIGGSKLYGTNYEEKIANVLHLQEDPVEAIRQRVPSMLEQLVKYIEKPECGYCVFNIPGTIYQARLSLNKERDKWFVRAEMSKALSGTALISFLKFAPLEEQREYLKTKEAIFDAEKKLTDLYYSAKQRESE